MLNIRARPHTLTQERANYVFWRLKQGQPATTDEPEATEEDAPENDPVLDVRDGGATAEVGGDSLLGAQAVLDRLRNF